MASRRLDLDLSIVQLSEQLIDHLLSFRKIFVIRNLEPGEGCVSEDSPGKRIVLEKVIRYFIGPP